MPDDSLLTREITRLEAWRRCLEAAVGLVGGRPGPVLELGLGNGRSYDHLRARIAEGRIFAFDRRLSAHPDCVPPEGHLFLGEIGESLACAREDLGGRTVLAHIDLGPAAPDEARNQAEALAAALPGLLAPEAVVLSDRALPCPPFAPLPLPPADAVSGRFLYRYRARA